MVCITLVKSDAPKGVLKSGHPPAQGNSRKPQQETSLTQQLRAKSPGCGSITAGRAPWQGRVPHGRDHGQAVLESNLPCRQGKHLCQAEPPDGMERLVSAVPQPCQTPRPHAAPGTDEPKGQRPAHQVYVLLHILAVLPGIPGMADVSFPCPCSCLAASPS